MWFFRGAQSAVFYYLACTPCNKANYRQKRKNDAVRQREKAARDREVGIVTDQPRPFPQPTPFTTNPSWAEDIALGPGPYRRGRIRGDREFSPIEVYQFSHHMDDNARTEQWVGMHFQREDEALWGQDGWRGWPSDHGGVSDRIDAKEPDNYCIPKVPPVNALHPPVVSGPKSRAEVSWMLQPPPIARIMEGKEPPNRRLSSQPREPRNGVRGDQKGNMSSVVVRSKGSEPPDHRQDARQASSTSTTLQLKKSPRAKDPPPPPPPQSIAPVARRPARALQPSIASLYYQPHLADDLVGNYSALSDSTVSTPSISRKSTPTQHNAVDIGQLIRSLSSHSVAETAPTNMSKESLEMQLRKLQASDGRVVTALEQFHSNRPPYRWSIDF